MSMKDAVIRLFWGDPFYRRVLQPLDRYHRDPKPSRDFGVDGLPLNKVCRVGDAAHALWRRGYDDLGFPSNPKVFHRKVWEFNQTLYGLRCLRRLAPDASALGIGCGHEELMYFLANRVRRVLATDLYEGTWIGGESDADVLEHPAKYAPFKYRAAHLEVQRMNALALTVDDGVFDFAFCLSSIEHFGRIEDKLTSLKEMFRILKPGGVAVLTTELVLNRLGRGPQYFQEATLLDLVRQAGFTLEGTPDLIVESESAARPLALPMETFVSPHVVLRNFNTIYTSVALFLMKPPVVDPHANALVGDERDAPREPYRYAASISHGISHGAASIRARPETPLTVDVVIQNTGDATWFAAGSRSHIVRVGASFVTRDGENLTGEPQRFSLPGPIRPGACVTLPLSLVAPRELVDGDVRLHVGLVKESYFWFRDCGSPDFVIPVEPA